MSNFSKNESFKLTEIWSSPEIQNQFSSIKKGHRHVWDSISDQLAEQNIHKTGTQCKNRISNLKKEFYKIKRKPTGSGQSTWPYFDHFARVLGGSAICDPIVVIDSLDPEECELLDIEDGPHDSPKGDSIEDESDPLETSVRAGPSTATPNSSLPDQSKNAFVCSQLTRNKGRKRKLAEELQNLTKMVNSMEEAEKNQLAEQRAADVEFLKSIQQLNGSIAQLVQIEAQKLDLQKKSTNPI